MKTSELVLNFELENGNPMTDITIEDHGQTIIVILEGAAEKEFPKPLDFYEYIKNLGHAKNGK